MRSSPASRSERLLQPRGRGQRPVAVAILACRLRRVPRLLGHVLHAGPDVAILARHLWRAPTNPGLSCRPGHSCDPRPPATASATRGIDPDVESLRFVAILARRTRRAPPARRSRPAASSHRCDPQPPTTASATPNAHDWITRGEVAILARQLWRAPPGGDGEVFLSCRVAILVRQVRRTPRLLKSQNAFPRLGHTLPGRSDLDNTG